MRLITATPFPPRQDIKVFATTPGISDDGSKVVYVECTSIEDIDYVFRIAEDEARRIADGINTAHVAEENE